MSKTCVCYSIVIVGGREPLAAAGFVGFMVLFHMESGRPLVGVRISWYEVCFN